jgi:DNA-binding MarR family transcriptional regulator
MTTSEALASHLAQRFLGVSGWTWDDVAREVLSWGQGQPASARQLDVLREFARRDPERPTMQELIDALGMSTTGVVYPHIQGLVARGLLSAGPPHTSRRYSLAPAGRDLVAHGG